jgi:hypothetical protein
MIYIGDVFERWRVIAPAPDAGKNMWGPKCHRRMNPGALTIHLPACGSGRRRHRRKNPPSDGGAFTTQPRPQPDVNKIQKKDSKHET